MTSLPGDIEMEMEVRCARPSEMVAHIAAAMRAESGGKPFTWENAARAAIEAMQAPTHEMMEAGANACAKTVSRMKSANVCYRAMIAAALLSPAQRSSTNHPEGEQ